MSTEDRNEKIRPLELYRQPAYAAVYKVIREYPPRSSDDYGQAVENARVWRAVEAALDAAGVPADDLAGYPVRHVIGVDRQLMERYEKLAEHHRERGSE